MILTLTDYQAAKILEAGRFIGEQGQGPDLSDVCDQINEINPNLKPDLGELNEKESDHAEH